MFFKNNYKKRLYRFKPCWGFHIGLQFWIEKTTVFLIERKLVAQTTISLSSRLKFHNKLKFYYHIKTHILDENIRKINFRNWVLGAWKTRNIKMPSSVQIDITNVFIMLFVHFYFLISKFLKKKFLRSFLAYMLLIFRISCFSNTQLNQNHVLGTFVALYFIWSNSTYMQCSLGSR